MVNLLCMIWLWAYACNILRTTAQQTTWNVDSIVLWSCSGWHKLWMCNVHVDCLLSWTVKCCVEVWDGNTSFLFIRDGSVFFYAIGDKTGSIAAIFLRIYKICHWDPSRLFNNGASWGCRQPERTLAGTTLDEQVTICISNIYLKHTTTGEQALFALGLVQVQNLNVQQLKGLIFRQKTALTFGGNKH